MVFIGRVLHLLHFINLGSILRLSNSLIMILFIISNLSFHFKFHNFVLISFFDQIFQFNYHFIFIFIFFCYFKTTYIYFLQYYVYFYFQFYFHYQK